MKIQKTGIRKADLLLISAVFILALILLLSRRTIPSDEASNLVVSVAGEEFGRYPLTGDREISIGAHNVCEIRNGAVLMIHADCPDGLCLHEAAIRKSGESIVCLPNRVVLKLEGPGDHSDIDAVAR